MKRTQTLRLDKYIDITDLSDFLRSDWRKQFNFDGHHMQLIEEVVFLCANENFINDIEAIRKLIHKKYPNFDLPANSNFRAERILTIVYEQLYKPYKRAIETLIQKYRLLPFVYWQDKLFLLDSKIEDEMKEAMDYDERITKKEAKLRAIEAITNDISPDLLDNIIIRNKPYSNDERFPFWVNPYFTRKTSELTGLGVSVKKEGLAKLVVDFPPYATLAEMQDLLKKNYKIIQEYREKHLPVSTKRDHRKDNLPKMIDAYMQTAQGKKKVEIANFLDKRYGGNITFEGVTQLVSRIKDEAARFNKETRN